MSTCKWDREAGDYLNDGEPCKYDEHGDPTYHCQARRTCSQHVGRGEQTCARCISRVRQDLRAIVQLAALMPVEALTGGVNSEAAMLAGPSADVEAWSWRKITARQGGTWHVSLPCQLDHVHRRCQPEEDDDWHPATVLTRAQWHIAMNPNYPPLPEVMTMVGAAEYLDKHLHRVAQDPDHDFAELRGEMRKCRQHLEAVLHNSTSPERGAPCPDCATGEPKTFVRLQREYGHFCLDPDCTQQDHFLDDTGDWWVCPKDRGHRWTAKAYRDYIQERTSA